MTDLDRLTASLADRYTIERELGAGGMATVYLAHDIRHDRRVALKVLRPELAAVIGGDRFLQEIKTTANLHHAHILPLHDSGEADGQVYYVMPYIEGESLRARLDRDTQLPVEEAVRIAREVADALDYAHRQGVIHRDIKPDNILLHDGHVVVADFGIALAASRSDDGSRMTETGMSLGTPHYMSPEQAMGDRDIRASSDVYALACVLYEMLMGEPPFTGPTAQAIVAKVMTDDPAGMALHRKSIPPHVEGAVLQALQKLPADRFASAAEFSAALAGATTARMTSGIAAPAPARPGPWRTVAIALGIVALAATAVALWAVRRTPSAATVRVAVAFPAGERIRPTTTRRFDLARDGSRMVYLGPDSVAGHQIWVRDMDALTARPVPGTGGALAPFLSPDGESVGFFTGNPGDLRVASITGGPILTIVRDSALPWGGSWGEDGAIYFTNGRALVGRVAPGGGAVEVVSRHDSASGVIEHDWAQALPGGKYVLVQTWRSSIANTKLGLLDLATGDVTDLVDGVYGRYVPTGHIVYATLTGALLRVPLDLAAGRVTSEAAAVADGIPVDAVSGSAQFAVSDNGLLVFVQGGGASGGKVVWVDRDGTQTPVDSAWVGQFNKVVLSPDGTQLAVSMVGGTGEHTWVKRLPDGPVSRVTYGGSINARPVWTPDGRRLAFISVREGGNREAWVQRADGSDEARLLARHPSGAEEVTWLPDGTRFMVRVGSSTGLRDIHLRTEGDSVSRVLVSGSGDEFAPTVSPDGRWFAYVTNESGRNEVFVRLVDDPGAGRTQVSLDGGEEPLWSRTGDELFYRTRRGEMVSVPVIADSTFRAGPAQVLFVAPTMGADGLHRAYDVAPDGRFLMIDQTSDQPTDLVMVFNWFDEWRDPE